MCGLCCCIGQDGYRTFPAEPSFIGSCLHASPSPPQLPYVSIFVGYFKKLYYYSKPQEKALYLITPPVNTLEGTQNLRNTQVTRLISSRAGIWSQVYENPKSTHLVIIMLLLQRPAWHWLSHWTLRTFSSPFVKEEARPFELQDPLK